MARKKIKRHAAAPPPQMAEREMSSSYPFWASPWLAAFFLIVAGLLVFSNNYAGEFIFDDYDTIVNNARIKTFSPFWSPLWITEMTPISGRPVIALTFALNYAAGGLDLFGYHLVNNIFHIMVGLILFLFLRSTLLLPCFAPRFGAYATVYSLAVTLLWLIHPLQTEAVNYITQRTEIMTILFYLLTLYLALKGFAAGRPQVWYAASIFFCGLGMASKEIIVSAPLAVLIYDRLFVSRSYREAFRRHRGLYLGLAGTWVILALFMMLAPHGSAVRLDGFGRMDFWPLDYLKIQIGVIINYIKLAFWPEPLLLSYQDLPRVREITLLFLAKGGLLCVLGLATIWGLIRGAWWSFPGFCFFAILGPSSSIIPMPYELATERRMYLPLAALIVLVVFGVDAFLRKMTAQGATQSKKRVYGVALLLVAALSLVLGFRTHVRNRDYTTEVGIWADTVAKRPGNSHARENLGKALMQEGRIDEAVVQFREAARLQPDDAEIFSNLGSALSQAGNRSEAVAMHQRAIELEPESAVDRYHLGNTYLRFNEFENAVKAYQETVKINPDFLAAHWNMGLLLMQKGEYAAAAHSIESVVRLTPDDPRALATLAGLQVKLGKIDSAISLYRKVLKIDPQARDVAEQIRRLQASPAPRQTEK